MSQRAYAHHRGVSHTAVQKALAAGRITLSPDGTIDPAVADQQWADSTDATKAANAEQDSSRLDSTFRASHAAREGYLARMAKLEYEKKSGKLVDADEVRAQMFALGRRTKEGFMALADRVTPQLVGQTDPAAVHRVITEEVAVVLAELAASTAASSPPKSSS